MTSFDKSVDDKTVKHAKLEWYREVLHLEPNSKLFLPLARLLAELGTEEQNADLVNEAFNILRRGLEIHPDFMEARLFLIELLNMCGCKAQCGAEVARLASLFLSYPDFWDAWREYAITENESTDFTVALGFMSAIMRNKSLSIVQVLEAGLNALKSSSSPVLSGETIQLAKNIQESPVVSMPAESFSQVSSCLHSINPEAGQKDFGQAEFVQNEKNEAQVSADQREADQDNGFIYHNEDVPLTENTDFQKAGNLSEIDEGYDAGGIQENLEYDETGFDSPELFDNIENPESENLADEFREPDDFGQDNFVEDDFAQVDSEQDLSDVLPKSHLENYASFAEQQKSLQEQILQEKTRSTKETLAALIKDANITVEPSTSSPFRTKSMADLLAEQGDYKGALDIYQELLHKGYGNKEELSERIADIKMLAPELVVEIDKSKLLAIDDFVDTSFFETGNIQNAVADDEDFAAENSFAEDLSTELPVESSGDLPMEFSERLSAEEISVGQFSEQFAEPAAEFVQDEMSADKVLDDDVLDDEVSADDIIAGEMIAEDVIFEGNAEIMTDIGSVEEHADSAGFAEEQDSMQEGIGEEKPAKQARNVADLLTKLAERLEIRGNR